MIRHIVIPHFQKKYGLDFEGLLETTRPLLAKISGDVASLGVEILFEDKEALDLFMDHRKHFEANAIFEKYLADPPYMVLYRE
jgi:hypothetical protein